MDIFTVNLKPKVLTYNDGAVKIFVDYPNIEQGQELDRLKFSALNVGFEVEWEEKDGKKYPDMSKMTSEQLVQLSEAMTKVNSEEKILRLRYCIKGWEGIKDEDGNEYKCELVNNALTYEVLNIIAKSEWVETVYKDMMELLRFDDNDKKKFI